MELFGVRAPAVIAIAALCIARARMPVRKLILKLSESKIVTGKFSSACRAVFKSDDSQAQIWEIPVVFAQKESENRQAPKSGHLQNQSGCEEARKSGAVFQAKLKSRVKKATLGFRLKSGWAAVVVMSGPPTAPRMHGSYVAHLCDAKVPSTRQPYHAAMGELETNGAKLKIRLDVVRRVANQSVAKILADCRARKLSVRRAGVVVGSQVDPATIANPHIRAHALEGELFRTVVVNALRAEGVRSITSRERDIYSEAVSQLKKTRPALQCSLQVLGESVDGPWRAEQKLAALAAWMAL
jgi:hypothetical protein